MIGWLESWYETLARIDTTMYEKEVHLRYPSHS